MFLIIIKELIIKTSFSEKSAHFRVFNEQRTDSEDLEDEGEKDGQHVDSPPKIDSFKVALHR